MTQRMAIATVATVLACITLSAGWRPAAAQEPAPVPGAVAPGQPGAVAPGQPGAAVAAEAPPEMTDVARYGIALRMPRWVSIPKWFLNFMTVQNKPLSTFSSFG